MSNTSLQSLKEEFAAQTEEVQARAVEPGRLAAGMLLLVLIAFHVAANLWWLREDNHTVRTDEEGHMLSAREYHTVLFVNDYADPVRRLIAVSEIRPGIPAHPPLFHIMGACMIAIFGYSTDVIAGTSTLLFALLLAGCYLLARTFLRPWQSLFAVFVVSFTPMVFAASRYFMTDYASAALVVWAVYALVKSNGFQRPGWVFLFGVLNGLGILARTITFAYLLFPAAAVVLSGLFRLLRNKPNDFRRGSYAGLAVNTLMALTVTAGIFGPWYYTNLGPFYDYWANKEIGGSRGPLTNFVPAPAATEPAPVATAGAPVGTAGAAKEVGGAEKVDFAAIAATIEDKFKHPPVAWIRYPVDVVNNGLFIPLAVLCALGMVLALSRAQFRGRAVVLLYGWVLGSWVIFSVLIRSATARYAVPVAPALAFFGALFVLALPGRWVRLTAGSLLGFVLLFQYGNLTFHSYGDRGNAVLPVPLPAAEAHHFIDHGLVLYKDRLVLGFSYSALGPPTRDNYKERLIQAMLAHERSLPVREGRYANYQKLNLRGMELYEQHVWPGDNPYLQMAPPETELPDRRLEMIHMGTKPEHLLPRLADTDYILYQVEAGQPAQADAYVAYFGARGFEPIESFTVPGFGWVPATINGVLARKLEGELLPVNADSIAAMDLYDIHELKCSADFQLLSPELRALAQATFVEKLNAVAAPFQLNEAVTFMAADVSRVGADTYRFRLVFQVHKAMDRAWRMLFHGFVEEANRNDLPPDKQAQGYQDWNFDPQPPTPEWVPGDYAVVTHQIVARPLVYQFKFGFFREDTQFGRTALLRPMDLGAVP